MRLQKEHVLTYHYHFDNGIDLFKMIQNLNLQGIIAKRKDSLYFSGRRSQSWLKIKVNVRQEYVIGGWSSADGKSFKTLLLGQYVEDKFTYIHHSGGGYTNKQKKKHWEMIAANQVSKCPFVNPKAADVDAPTYWCKPVLVGDFEQSNLITKSCHIRHPINLKGCGRITKRRTWCQGSQAIRLRAHRNERVSQAPYTPPLEWHHENGHLQCSPLY